MEDLKEQIKLVAILRSEKKVWDETIKASKAEWELKNQEILNQNQKCQEALEENEKKLRDMTVAAYIATQDKQPCPGVGIRVTEMLDYDYDQAFSWAIGHELCLKLDQKAFEDIAKSTKLDFVTYGQLVKATIATDLEKYVEG